jgi:sec-independent protein translocase protein TatB
MFDLDVTKMLVLGAVGLVVLGPERMPRVARTVGTLVGRAQRYLADVKAEVGREMQLDELKNMRQTVKTAAASVQSAIRENMRTTEESINSAFATPSTDQMVAAQTASAPPAPPLPVTNAKRLRWRRNVAARQAATPRWYRQVNKRRSHVQSAAARVSRYRVPSSTSSS